MSSEKKAGLLCQRITSSGRPCKRQVNRCPYAVANVPSVRLSHGQTSSGHDVHPEINVFGSLTAAWHFLPIRIVPGASKQLPRLAGYTFV